MTEATADGMAPSGDTPTGPTAGAMLRQAREALGLHVAALAVALKVPVRKLEALEEDRYDQLPDAVFVRALASSVCRTLKIDPQPVLDRLPQTAKPRLINDRDGINTPFRAPSDGAGPSWTDHMSKPVFLAVFALLLGALVLIFLPARDDGTGGRAGDTNTAQVAMTGPAAGGQQMPLPAAMPSPQPEQLATQVVTPAPAASSGMTASDSTPKVLSPTVVLTPSSAMAKAATSTTALPSPTTGLVVFKTRGPSWVEVTDAKGVVALRRLLAAGETAGASGALPLAVVIGSANTTDVQVRGKAYDLAAVSRDNVARFEVK